MYIETGHIEKVYTRNVHRYKIKEKEYTGIQVIQQLYRGTEKYKKCIRLGNSTKRAYTVAEYRYKRVW